MTRDSKTRVVLPGLLAAAVVFLVFLPSLFNGFVNWDDPAYVYENLNIRTFGPSFFRWAFTSIVVSNWHPLTMVSFGLDYLVWGLNPVGYHLTAVLIHAANVYLVYAITLRLVGLGEEGAEAGFTSTPAARAIAVVGAAFVAALLFGLHPLKVESVSWVSERKDVLAALFYLLSVHAYLGYAGEGRRGLYAASLIWFAAAMLSKPMAVTLPITLLILDIYPLGRLRSVYGAPSSPLAAAWRPVAEKIPFFVLSVVVSVATMAAQKGAMSGEGVVSAGARAATALKGYWFYLHKTVWPADLAPLYPHPVNPSLISSEYLGYAALFAAISAVAFLLRRRLPAFGAAWLYYVAALVPVIGLVQVGTQGAADRYAYLPTIGFFILVGLAVGRAASRLAWPWRYLPAVCAAAAVMALGLLTVRQEAVWKGPVELWTHEIEYLESQRGASGDAGPTVESGGVVREFEPRILAYYNRAGAFAEAGELSRAVEDYDKVVAFNPEHAGARNNRGVALARAGDLARAVEDFSAAIRVAPKEREGYLNRAQAYRLLGQADLAEEDAMTAASLNR